MPVPYANASSGLRAREEIGKILQHFGCESVGFMDEFAERAVVLAFVHRGRQVQLRASAKGWASAWLRENPWTHKRRATRAEWDERAIKQGMIAVNSILRDWVKGQITAIETGVLSFDHVFMPHMLMPDGRKLIEHVHERLLPAPAPSDSETPKGEG